VFAYLTNRYVGVDSGTSQDDVTASLPVLDKGEENTHCRVFITDVYSSTGKKKARTTRSASESTPVPTRKTRVEPKKHVMSSPGKCYSYLSILFDLADVSYVQRVPRKLRRSLERNAVLQNVKSRSWSISIRMREGRPSSQSSCGRRAVVSYTVCGLFFTSLCCTRLYVL
jgi:hypothetical protein